MPTAKSRAEAQSQKAKSSPWDKKEFSAKDLRTVGNYTLGRLIGKGSFGKVYLATHKLTNGSKVVLKSANKDDSNLAREIHHHRQFNHPHIARLYEVIVTESLVWLVLEYCPGDELYNYLLRHGPLPVEKVQRIFTQLVGAVSYVHNKSCVHRDLKLENILLDKHDNVKLCDFGFTREYEGKASYLQTFCGTVCYSAPEMLKGEKYAGEKVDIWSLGVILYALLTGELPFDEDDDGATKIKILGSEPSYPEHLPAEAKKLISLLLSKRPLLRPSLSDILASPFLAEHASQQQVILKLQQPPPFTTKLEKDTLERMQGAGVDIDKVIENVLSQRCDSLAGWWTLLLEREERKEKRRERRRREKEIEAKNLRRLSAASSRLERMGPTLKEVDEEGEQGSLTRDSSRRGRQRSNPNPQLILPELPRLAEVTLSAEKQRSTSPPPPPIDKDSIHSASSSRYRPPPPPKESARRSRTSTLQLVSSNPDLLSPNGFVSRRQRRKNQHPILSHLAQIKHWLMDSAKRARSPSSRSSRNNQSAVQLVKEKTPPPHRSGESNDTDLKKQPGVSVSAGSQPRTTHPPPSQHRGTMQKRASLSPAPLTPHASYRRSSAGLRGRKSTSSSISSIRSIHHHHSHSKASSTSSASITSSVNKTPRSPRNSVKVLPATPTASTFPSNIRVVRSPLTNYNETANFGGLGSPGLVFARRKKHTFKGPTLNVNTATANGGSSSGSSRRDSGPGRRSISASRQPPRRSGEIIEEEDEEEIEEVDAFSPVVGPGEVEETIEGELDAGRGRLG
ncbi:MAG: glyceraldehyde-3-phosphate dehydrogenase 1 [Chaenotheca gracillima]|nr:MAG: glyceraldehyde-3-phosphate dehydrogenase 1 [Chaenotheca gracillima]